MPDVPDFSVLVTTRNRPAKVAALLSSLAAFDYPLSQFEVIIADDGSDQPLDPIVAPFAERLPLRLLRGTPGGPSRGRNLAAASARGRYFAFTDDDCLPDPSWLHQLKRALDANPGAAIGGYVANGLPSNPFSTASQLVNDMVYDHYNRDPRNARFFCTNNLAVPADRFRSLGGFDETFPYAEDREFCERWRAAGFPLIYEPAAVIRHCHVLTLRSFFRQHFNYGQGAAHFHRKTAVTGSDKIRNHLGFHRELPAAVARILRRMPPLAAVTQIALFSVWQLANAAGFFYWRMRQ